MRAVLRRRFAARSEGGASAARLARTTADSDTLTDREREVLLLVVADWPTSRSPVELGISERTVKAHLTNVFQRLGVTDRTQAALWASEHLTCAR